MKKLIDAIQDMPKEEKKEDNEVEFDEQSEFEPKSSAELLEIFAGID